MLLHDNAHFTLGGNTLAQRKVTRARQDDDFRHRAALGHMNSCGALARGSTQRHCAAQQDMASHPAEQCVTDLAKHPPSAEVVLL